MSDTGFVVDEVSPFRLWNKELDTEQSIGALRLQYQCLWPGKPEAE